MLYMMETRRKISPEVIKHMRAFAGLHELKC
jgi:hypothetical protein